MGHLGPKELIFTISPIFGPGASPRGAETSEIFKNSYLGFPWADFAHLGLYELVLGSSTTFIF